jgi:hypothetical protein
LSDLRNFCEYIVKKYGTPDAASEDDKASEFRNIFLQNMPLDIRSLRTIASACGIKVSGIDKDRFPKSIRGFHDVFENRRNIYYKKGDTKSGIENTILHEFREMIEPVFADICPDYNLLRTNAVHLAANKFATAVLLPEDDFREKVYDTGLDVIELSRLYSKSCSQVLLRMGEVLRGRLFFYGALYELDPEKNNWKVNYWTGSANHEYPDTNIFRINELFPKKGRRVDTGSLVDMVIRKKRPYMVEHITLEDAREDEGLTAIARLLTVSGKVTKVALVVVHGLNGNILVPQIERAKPVRIEGFHRHL